MVEIEAQREAGRAVGLLCAPMGANSIGRLKSKNKPAGALGSDQQTFARPGRGLIPISSKIDEPAFTAAEFAERHGLTLKFAEIILFANGPSRVACDAAARAFWPP